MMTFSLLLLVLMCLFTSLISKIPAFVLFLRNFFVRGLGVFKKIPTRRDFFVYLKIITTAVETEQLNSITMVVPWYYLQMICRIVYLTLYKTI